MNFLPHVFGLIALLVWVSSIQVKRKSNILWLQLLSNICYAIQYFLLGLISTACTNVISIYRCYTFGMSARKNKKSPLWVFLLIILAILISGLLFCKNYLDLLPIFATLLYTIFTWQNNTKYIRYVFILCGFIFAIYNSAVGAYISLIGNFFEIGSGIIAVIRFRKEDKKEG